MIGRRFAYLLLLLGVSGYYIASGEWIAWILLLVVLGLPWLSLLVSLPALISLWVSPAGVDILEMGEESDLWLLGSCSYPMPPFRGKIRIHCLLSGDSWRYTSGDGVPTEHCGGYRCTVERVRMCDYMGLFSFKVRKTKDQTVIVRPKPLPVEDLVDPKQLETERWVPKPGGGFAENHEHRLYRPGDGVNQIHWKLSAKVGDLIIREPMVPVRGAVLVTLSNGGTAAELDRKLGKLLWVGRFLLERGLEFEVKALTGLGVQNHRVTNEAELLHAVDSLLTVREAGDDSGWDYSADASWQYHIGGEADEA